MDIYIPICLNGTVWFADKNILKQNGKSLIKTVKDVKPTIFVGVPRVWEKIADQIKIEATKNNFLNVVSSGFVTKFTPKFIVKNKVLSELGLDECKYCISTGAPISDVTLNYFDSLGISVYDVYGLSETSGPISISLPKYRRRGSVGVLLDGLRVKINMDGEILVKGSSVTKGYFRNKKETLKSFQNGWFKTGDLGNIDKGYLFVTGRKKDIIISSGGENISPIIIEQNVRKYFNEFDYSLVVGDKKKYLTLLLFPNTKYFSKYKYFDRVIGPNKKYDISDSDSENDESCEDEAGKKENKIKKIHSLISGKIRDVNKLSPNSSHKIQKWMIILDSLILGDDVTPTHKIKRHYLYKKYHDEINRLYYE